MQDMQTALLRCFDHLLPETCPGMWIVRTGQVVHEVNAACLKPVVYHRKPQELLKGVRLSRGTL